MTTNGKDEYKHQPLKVTNCCEKVILFYNLQINDAQHHVTILEAEKRVLQGKLSEANSADERHDLEEKLVSQLFGSIDQLGKH